MDTKKLETLLLVVFLVFAVLCGRYLYQYYHDSQQNKQGYQELADKVFKDESQGKANPESEEEADESEDGFDYSALLAENEDCIGWLRIDGTDIDYPVVQGVDNEEYLHQNFAKQYAICGTLFLDAKNQLERSQEHLVIYGHQMKDGTMFKQLNEYKNQAFYEEHRQITFYQKEEKCVYEIAAVYVTSIEKSGKYYEFLHKETRKEQIEYLEGLAAYQLYDTGVKVSMEDELLSLSTCEYSSTNGRLIVLARKMTEGGQ